VSTLRNLAVKLFKKDPPPSSRLAQLVRVRQRQAQYWLSGRDPSPPDVIETLKEQVAAVEQFDLESRIDRLIDDAAAAGIDIAVTAHYLTAAVESSKD
jgi:hypothetical protein